MRELKRIYRNANPAFMLVFCLLGSVTMAESVGPYVLEWSTIDGGGGVSTGGQYVLEGTIGQADAAYSSGGPYEVSGGFWPGGPMCFVEFDDFARFADYWLATGAGLPADLYEDGSVDWLDLREFAYEWLYECPYRWPLR